MSERKIKILLVCLGNICRSPTAHGVLQRLAEKENLANIIEIDSAGTYGAHVGEMPDRRAMAAASERGYDLGFIRSRKITDQDFTYFDYILAMDHANLADLTLKSPSNHQHKIKLFLSYGSLQDQEVPDPYYGGKEGFNHVLDLVEDAAKGLIHHIKSSA